MKITMQTIIPYGTLPAYAEFASFYAEAMRLRGEPEDAQIEFEHDEFFGEDEFTCERLYKTMQEFMAQSTGTEPKRLWVARILYVLGIDCDWH